VLHDDRVRAGSFGDDAAQYDRSRPTYPPELIDAILADGARRVLDVGVGTGIVARLLHARGCDVLGVEPDDRMAAVARGWGVSVERGTFEQWDARGRSFDLIVSGQAWHWVAPELGAAKAASVLRPGGRAALFWNQGLLPSPLKERLRAAYRKVAPGLDNYSIVLGNIDDGRFEATSRGLSLTGAFDPPETCSFPWRRSYTTEQWIDQLTTHSDHRTRPRARGAGARPAPPPTVDEIGGRFEMGYRTWLVTARRRVDVAQDVAAGTRR
jgi:SAM-dependent methyltransferase